jgi:hypothetical protein
MEEQLTFRISRELARALARRSRERAVPRAQVVREALVAYLGGGPVPQQGAAWQRVRGLVGALALDPAAAEADVLARRIRAQNWRESD